MKINDMLSLKAKKREKIGRKTKILREKGVLPGVLYGEGIKEALSLEVSEKDFGQIFKEAGTSSLVSLEIDGKKHEVLIHDCKKDSLSEKISHIDFFKPSTKKEITAPVILEFLGEAPAVKDFAGNLIKEIQKVIVKGLAHKLPKSIKVDLEKLKNFEDRIFISDLEAPEGVKILREQNEIVALVVPQKEEKEEKEEAPKAEEAKEGAEAKEGGEKKEN